MKRVMLFFLLLSVSTYLHTDELDHNILIYDEGNIQVSSSINHYDEIVPGMPVKGSVMITRATKDKVDAKSFRLGNHPLKVEFIESQPFSSYDGSLVIDIYHFQFDGIEAGDQTLPSITVLIDGRQYAAPPINIQVLNKG